MRLCSALGSPVIISVSVDWAVPAAVATAAACVP
ncbi:Uncharacterised protein [Mycobacterium tuberculosis]|nr:Uncharacterised protein [Mycobacterium tuberculosis]